jgi:RNA recognition motif-containing protein
MATPMSTPGLGMGGSGMLGVQRLPPEVNRILYVRNLPFNMSPEELYKIFGDYGAIRQIRMYDTLLEALCCCKMAGLTRIKSTRGHVRAEDVRRRRRALHMLFMKTFLMPRERKKGCRVSMCRIAISLSCIGIRSDSSNISA